MARTHVEKRKGQSFITIEQLRPEGAPSSLATRNGRPFFFENRKLRSLSGGRREHRLVLKELMLSVTQVKSLAQFLSLARRGF
jgi:hypothetical protein